MTETYYEVWYSKKDVPDLKFPFSVERYKTIEKAQLDSTYLNEMPIYKDKLFYVAKVTANIKFV